MNIKTWNIEAMTGYKPRTTFYEDFSIADHFGGSAIRDTYCRALVNAHCQTLAKQSLKVRTP